MRSHPLTCDAGLPVDVLQRQQLVVVDGRVGRRRRARRVGVVARLVPLPLVDRVPLVPAGRRVQRRLGVLSPGAARATPSVRDSGTSGRTIL